MAMFRHHPMTFRARRENPRPLDELEQGILDRHGACGCGLSGATLWQWGVFHVEKPLNWVMTLGLNHRTQPVGHCQRVA